MLQLTFLLLIIFLVALILAVSFGFLNYKIQGKVLDFYMMFLMGIVWVILGFLFKIWFLVFLGILFFAIGLYKRSEWPTNLEGLNRAHKEEITSVQTQTRGLEKLFGLIIFIGVLALAMIIFYIFVS